MKTPFASSFLEHRLRVKPSLKGGGVSPEHMSLPRRRMKTSALFRKAKVG
jgi:hypothetical protein